MYKGDPERFKIFWAALQDMWKSLYTTKYPTVAVINGHAIAGGCLLAISCEYRIMVYNYSIGLNETAVGIPVPRWLMETMKGTISNRQAEIALTAGMIFKTDEALKLGIVDEVAIDKTDGMKKALRFISRFATVDPRARQMTKEALRGKIAKELETYRCKEVEEQTELMFKPDIQNTIGNLIASLKKNKEKR